MKTLAEVESAFRENFLVVANVITQSGAQLAFNVSGSAGGVGGLPTIIIRRLDRGFGLVLENEFTIRGMRNLKYRIDDLASPKQNADFILELERRLSISGSIREEIYDTAGNTALAHWKESKRRFEPRVKTFHRDAY